MFNSFRRVVGLIGVQTAYPVSRLGLYTSPHLSITRCFAASSQATPDAPQNGSKSLTLESVLALQEASPADARRILDLYPDFPAQTAAQRVQTLQQAVFAGESDARARTLQAIYKHPALLRLKNIDRIQESLRSILSPRNPSGRQFAAASAQDIEEETKRITSALANHPAILTLDPARVQTKLDILTALLDGNVATARKLLLDQPDLLLAGVDSTIPERMDLLADLLDLTNAQVIELVTKLPRLLSPSLRLNRLLRLSVLRQPFLPRSADAILSEKLPERLEGGNSTLLAGLKLGQAASETKSASSTTSSSPVASLSSAIRLIAFQLTNRDFEQVFPYAPQLTELSQHLGLIRDVQAARFKVDSLQEQMQAPPQSGPGNGGQRPGPKALARAQEAYTNAVAKAAEVGLDAKMTSAKLLKNAIAVATAQGINLINALESTIGVPVSATTSTPSSTAMPIDMSNYGWMVLYGKIKFERAKPRDDDDTTTTTDDESLLTSDDGEDMHPKTPEQFAAEREIRRMNQQLERAEREDENYYREMLAAPENPAAVAQARMELQTEEEEKFRAADAEELEETFDKTEQRLHRREESDTRERIKTVAEAPTKTHYPANGRVQPVGPGGKKAKPWSASDEFGKDYPRSAKTLDRENTKVIEHILNPDRDEPVARGAPQ